MNLEITDKETVTLLKELDGLIDGDRFSCPRVKPLRAIRAKLRPELQARHVAGKGRCVHVFL
jgi:hypothetical protein